MKSAVWMAPGVSSKHSAGIAMVAVLVFVFHLPFAKGGPFFDDAADYAHAAQSPLLKTWLDLDSASAVELMHMRTEAEFRARPWDTLYSRGDNTALRHFHVPLSFYALRLAGRSPGDERAQRLLWCSVSAFACALLAWVLLRLGVAWAVALPVSLLAGWQSRFVEPSIDPSPHVFYMLFALLSLYAWSRFVRSGRERDLYATALTFALAFATLEFSVELLAAFPVSLAVLWMERRWSPPLQGKLWPRLLRALGLFLLVTFILWPGGWLRGGYVKCYGVLAATVLFKNKTAFGEKLTAGMIYDDVFRGHSAILLVAVFTVAGAVVLFLKKRLSVAGVVFLVYASMAFALGVADRFRLNTYVSEFLFFFLASAALVFADLVPVPESLRSWRGMAALCVAVCLLLGCRQEWNSRYESISYRPWLPPVFTLLRQKIPAGERVLTNDNKETLSLYVPQLRFDATKDTVSAAPRSKVRDEGARWWLLNEGVAPPAGTEPVASLPTTPGQSKTLYVRP